MQTLFKGAAGVASATSSTLKHFTGGEETEGGGKLTGFLTTLVTYPAFYLAATGQPATDGLGPNGVTAAALGGSAAAAARRVVSGKRVNNMGGRSGGGMAAAIAPELRGQLTDFPEGRAISTLERWCQEPVSMGRVDDLAFRLRDHIRGLLAWHQAHAPHLRTEAENDRTYVGRIKSVLQTGTATVVSLTAASLDVYLGPAPPELSLPEVVASKCLVSGPALNGHASPVQLVASSAAPNLHFIQAQLQHRYQLPRGRTWFEYMLVLLSGVRLWLGWVASGFFIGATFLRIMGNGLSALGGLVAFTVVLSVAISVLSALTFLAASACDATGAFITYLSRFTDVARRRSVRVRQATFASASEQDTLSRLGPLSLGPASFEELEEFLTRQLPLSSMSGAIRSRPDVPRLAHDALALRCYDLQLVDSSGSVLPGVMPDDVAARWDPSGFFGHATPAVRKGASVLLLRLLAWRCIASIMSPAPLAAPTGFGDGDEALRYVWIMGVEGAGATTLYRALAGLPQEYQVADAKRASEIRALQRHRNTYVVLSRQGAAASWMTDLSHGVVSCLVFLVSVEADPEQVVGGGSRAAEQGGTDKGSAAALGEEEGGSKTEGGGAIAAVWQALELRRPVLFAVNKAFKCQEQLVAEPGRTSETLAGQWTLRLAEAANRRGLEPELLTVALTELLDVPPPGTAGVPQVQEWLSYAIAAAPQQR